MLVEQVSVEESAPVVTDISFPDELGIPAASSFQVDDDAGWLSRLEQQGWVEVMRERARNFVARRRV
jgi:hypothetical protein